MSLTSRFYYRIIRIERVSRLFANRTDPQAPGEELALAGHVVICGYGITASNLALALDNRGFDYIVIDIDHRAIASARKKGIPCIYGDPSNPEILAQANLQKAKVLVITFRDPIAVRLVVENARRINRRLDIVARVRGDEHTEGLRALGVSQLVRPEVEVGLEIIRHTMHRFGLSPQETQLIISRLREEETEK